MKKILILTVAMLFVASMAFGNSIVGSKHDMKATFTTDAGTTQVCVFCHTPHQSTAANKQDPLWNHSVTARTVYGVYGSDTFNAGPTGANTIADIGTVNSGPGGQNTSLLCMGCHDGSVAVNALYKAPKDNTNVGNLKSITGSALLGTDLSDDHPINFTYDQPLVDADTAGSGVPGLKAPTAISNGTKLIGGKVQCASCHNVHDNQYPPFLRGSNVQSALCLGCHIK